MAVVLECDRCEVQVDPINVEKGVPWRPDDWTIVRVTHRGNSEDTTDSKWNLLCGGCTKAVRDFIETTPSIEEQA